MFILIIQKDTRIILTCKFILFFHQFTYKVQRDLENVDLMQNTGG